jgi:hypothetical protein
VTQWMGPVIQAGHGWCVQVGQGQQCGGHEVAAAPAVQVNLLFRCSAHGNCGDKAVGLFSAYLPAIVNESTSYASRGMDRQPQQLLVIQ